MSPTQRSLAFLRKRGYVAAVVERWNAHAKIRRDLFGFLDIIALGPGPDDGRVRVLGVQSTSRTNQSHRVAKILSDDLAEVVNLWLVAGCGIEVHGWAKRGARGKRKVWDVTVTTIPTR